MKSLPSTDSDRRALRGLTLLEVLAAAMIFGMVMTVLVGTSSTAIHHVGTSARRLEANLIADEILADLEIQMRQGIAPEVSEDESVRDIYSIRVMRSALGAEGSDTPALAGPDVSNLLGTELPEVAKHLSQYEIEVGWTEQAGPQRVTRTTFAFDWQAAAAEYGELFQAAGASPGTAFGGSGSGAASGTGIGPSSGGSGRSTRRDNGAPANRKPPVLDGGATVRPGENPDLPRALYGRNRGRGP